MPAEVPHEYTGDAERLRAAKLVEKTSVGDSAVFPGERLWYLVKGNLYKPQVSCLRTPQQLLDECHSVIRDLYRNHPELTGPSVMTKEKGGRES